MPKGASPDYPIHEVISSRWSPYCCSNRLIPREDLLRLFESVRWAASSFNEPPWHCAVATRDRIEEFEGVLCCLLEGGNRTWARDARGCPRLRPTDLLPERQARPDCPARPRTGLGDPHLRGNEAGDLRA